MIIVIDNHWHGTSVSLYTVQQFFHVLAKLHSDTCRNLLNLTKYELDGFDFLLANKDAASLWRANPSCKTARNCVEIHNMNLQRNWGGRTLAVKAEQKCVQIFGNEGRSEMWNYRSFTVNAGGKCGGGTSHIWQWRQSVSGEADLQIFGSQDWAKVQKWNCKSLEVQAEMKCGSPGRTSAISGTSDLCQPRQSGSAGAELHIFGSKGRAEVRKWNFAFLAVNAERKCGRWTSDLWKSSQSGNAEAEHQVFGSQDIAEVWKRNFRSLAVKTERKCKSSTLTVQSSWTYWSRS